MPDATSIADSAFPNEPFACPYCGQMLAPQCRTCVACNRSIDPAEIPKVGPVSGTSEPQTPRPSAIAPARFSWPIFFLVFGVTWLAAIIGIEIWGPERTQDYLRFLPMLSAPWVILDTHRKHIARPLRWAIGTLLIWPIVFPWYLARRRTPQAPCPFVEGIGLPIVIVVLLAVSLLIVLISGQAHYKIG